MEYVYGSTLEVVGKTLLVLCEAEAGNGTRIHF